MLWYLHAPVSAPMLDLYSNTCKRGLSVFLLAHAALIRRLQNYFLLVFCFFLPLLSI